MNSKYFFYDVEVTDTFGGDANYCWVHRHTIKVPAGKSPIRAAKKAEGWENVRCRVENHGDMLALYPAGACVVMFINFAEEV